MELEVGTQVMILERGEWVGPFTVTGRKGRTEDHIVLEGRHGPFEHYADEYNTKHDWEPGDYTSPMQTDPSCRICGMVKRSHVHN